MADDLDRIGDAELLGQHLQLAAQRPVAGHGELPPIVPAAEEREDLGEQQRVLLRLQTTDAEHSPFAVP